VRGLRRSGRGAFLAISGGRDIEAARAVAGGDISELLFSGNIESAEWAFIVTDRFSTPEAEFKKFSALAPVIGIDEGGPCRANFDFLFDILPALPSTIRANIERPAFLDLPLTRKAVRFPSPPASGARILVVFGAENPGGLAEEAAEAVKHLPKAEMTVITGVKDLVPNLRESLHSYDLVICHFGLCAFESLAAGTPVLLVSPTPYHERLAKAAGFFSAGTGRGACRRLPHILSHSLAAVQQKSRAVSLRYSLDAPAQETLAGFIAGISPEAKKACPVCGARSGPVIARFSAKSYRRCKVCGTVSMSRLAPPPQDYAKSYFFEDYAAQYGKTYLEDFDHLAGLGDIRAKTLSGLLKRAIRPQTRESAAVKLLDIGCAYGPFLAAAEKHGFKTLGVDVSEDAVDFINSKLGLKALTGSFPACAAALREDGGFEAVTLWYVIEHFTDAGTALREIAQLTGKGGVIAFSTPSASGVSACFTQRRFLEQSPEDHWIILSPKTVKKALSRFGFSVKQIVVTGHHPERLPIIGKFLKRGLFRDFFVMLSKLFALGDTFEVYARRE
jgi:2-polyprenyl-3-methyl-5-hydroxy-6-metoxy-1,4-benzoquinol methylase